VARFARDAVIPDGPAGRRQRMTVLLICSSSLFIVYLDSTILNVALPTLQRDFHASVSGLQWIADAYLLVVASLLMLTGSAADRLGRRRLFLTGLAGFGLGSLLCSLAPGTGWLIALRMLQGLGGSMLTPISLSIVRNTFHDPRERTRALGVWSAIFGVATACGPVVGGVLVTTIGWRSIFWLNGPICAAMIGATLRFVPESRAPRPRRADAGGQLLMIALLGSLTYALIQGPDAGWTAAPVLACFGVAVLAAAAFTVVERHRREPLVELRFFRSWPFTGASVIAVLAFTVLGGFLFVITLYLQQVRGDSPLRAGLSLLPATLVMAAAAPVAGLLTARRGPRAALVGSGLGIAGGTGLLLVLAAGTSYLYLAAALVVLGAGLGLVNPPITGTAISGMPPSQADVAAAVVSTTRQLGSLLGVAVLGDLVTTGVASGEAAGQTHAAALSGATHAAWAVGLACGLLVALAGFLSTTARARETARAAAEPAPAPPPAPRPGSS
jgi:EmrB/QacA subfamily drug resistance transporter